jgi:serine/threonine-protein kinase
MASPLESEMKILAVREADASAAASRFLAKLADRYIVDRRFGHGGMGLVYLARDVKLGRQVAIKVIRPEVAKLIDTDRFWGEIRLSASLQHPYILPVLDSGCVDDVYYSVTPYLPGGSLRAELRDEGSLPPQRAVRVTLDVLEALAHAHKRLVVHCDVKPENILLSNGHAILTDFGIARSLKRRPGRAKDEVSGSPEYVSPEQASGLDEIDGRSDLYSLGCVLYEMLAGSALFQGVDTQAVVVQRFKYPAPRLEQLPTSIPPGLVSVLGKALEVEPDRRHETAADFANDLLSATHLLDGSLNGRAVKSKRKRKKSWRIDRM